MKDVKPVLALPEEFHLMGLEKRDKVLTVTLVSTQASPCCPLCGKPASRMHSSYTRHAADLPCGGQSIRLVIQVRKYFCEENSCPRKIFAERLSPFVEPFARVTKRLCQVVQIIGLATGGRLGVRVTDRPGIQASRQTILRRIMALPTELVGQVPQIGIDDFSFRRGRTCGTIIVDLQTRKVLDVLPDRTKDSATAWMAVHPEIELVSRDPGRRLRLCCRDWGSSGREVGRPFPHPQELRRSRRRVRDPPPGGGAQDPPQKTSLQIGGRLSKRPKVSGALAISCTPAASVPRRASDSP